MTVCPMGSVSARWTRHPSRDAFVTFTGIDWPLAKEIEPLSSSARRSCLNTHPVARSISLGLSQGQINGLGKANANRAAAAEAGCQSERRKFLVRDYGSSPRTGVASSVDWNGSSGSIPSRFCHDLRRIGFFRGCHEFALAPSRLRFDLAIEPIGPPLKQPAALR